MIWWSSLTKKYMSSQRGDFQEEFEVLRQFSLDLLGSIQTLRWVGYGLLAFFGVNLLAVFVPFQFLDPEWELQVIGRVIDFIPLALIGLVFVLYGRQYARTKASNIFAKIFCWLALLLGVLMFLLIPLSIVDTWRIQTTFQQNIQQVLSQRLEKIDAVNAQVESTISDGQLVTLAEQFKSQYPSLNLDLNKNPAEIKKQILDLAKQAKNNVKKQSQEALNSQNLALLKNSLKLIIGSLISSIWLISLWRANDWTRKSKKRI